VEILATPLGGVFACVAVEDGEIALATDVGEIDNKRVGVFHRSSLSTVVCYTHLVPVWCARVLVEGLCITRVVGHDTLWGTLQLVAHSIGAGPGSSSDGLGLGVRTLDRFS
jgi:hypothetical protein